MLTDRLGRAFHRLELERQPRDVRPTLSEYFPPHGSPAVACGAYAGVMVRYGLDIDFEKFMVAHGDAANLCNEFDAVNLRRRHRRPAWQRSLLPVAARQMEFADASRRRGCGGMLTHPRCCAADRPTDMQCARAPGNRAIL
jgi:hypothetical protein